MMMLRYASIAIFGTMFLGSSSLLLSLPTSRTGDLLLEPYELFTGFVPSAVGILLTRTCHPLHHL